MTKRKNKQVTLETLVPFGKYEGKPTAQLLADKNYAQWLSAQPGINQQFPEFVLAIQCGTEPSEQDCTPVHNRMQAALLDNKLQNQIALCALKKSPWFNLKSLCQDCGLLGKPKYRSVRCSFEVGNWDAVIVCERVVYFCDEHFVSGVPQNFTNERFYIELKPQLGDDYPAVLRKVKQRRFEFNSSGDEISGLRVVLCDIFDSAAVNFLTAKEIFSSSGVILLSANEVLGFSAEMYLKE